jgi:hypothetical protein
MVNEEFGNKLKKLKSKNVTKKRKKLDVSQYMKFILLFIIAVGLLFGAYNVYNTITAKSLEEAQKFEDSKKDAITNINNMFSKYPNDPQKITYISKITEAKNSADIGKVMNEASAYINYKNNQQSKIAYIKNLCGVHYDECVYAQSVVNKIENAKSSQELNSILTTDVLNKIQNEAKDKYLEEKKHELEFGEYFSVNIGVTKKLMTKEEALNYISKMSLNELKQLSIERVSFNLITLTVSASQCGKIPMEGDYIYIYNKGSLASPQQTTQQTNQTGASTTTNVEPIECVVNASYVVAKDISYSESKSVSSSVSDDGGSSSASSSSSISYSLSSINGILHATAVDKLDYNKIKSKFGNYGLKLNKIEDDTQIFDSDVQYLLILSVPSDAVPELISMNSDDIYIVRAG